MVRWDSTLHVGGIWGVHQDRVLGEIWGVFVRVLWCGIWGFHLDRDLGLSLRFPPAWGKFLSRWAFGDGFEIFIGMDILGLILDSHPGGNWGILI